MLTSLSYQSVLARGYALVRDTNGQMIRLAGAVAPGAELSIEFADGRLAAEAKGPSAPAPAAGAAPGVRPARPKGPSRGGQGSLF